MQICKPGARPHMRRLTWNGHLLKAAVKALGYVQCPWKFKAQKNIFESFCSSEINIKVSKLLTFVALKKKFSSVISWEIPKNFSRFLRPTQGSLMNLQSQEDIDKSQDTDN